MIGEAAAEAGERIALIDEDGTMTFAEVCAAIRAMPAPDAPVFLTPRLDRATFLAIHHAIAHRVSLVMSHPRAHPEAEAARRARLLQVPDALAILQTSGSSGTPKEVVLSRHAFEAAARASAARLGWRRTDRWGLFLPPAHVGGLSVIVRCVLGRAAVVLGTSNVAEVLERHRVTLTSFVPATLHRLLSAGWRPSPHLRAVLLGGDAATPTLRAEALAAGVPILPTYGMTETCAQVATVAPGDDASGTSSGTPLEGFEVRTIEGELEVRGATLMDGYLQDGKIDRSGFRDGGWWPTGDLGYLDERGRVHVVGRLRDRIITGGENVDPAAVEAALLAVHGVRGACVFGVPDPRFGQRVAAVLVADRPLEACISEAMLADHERPRLGALVDVLPLRSIGKMDRDKTRALHAHALVAVQPVPESFTEGE